MVAYPQMSEREEKARKLAIEAIDEATGRLRELARFIHSHPELGFSERESSAAVGDLLENSGFEVQRAAGGIETAFVAKASNSGPGPRVAFLAEYDALPGLGHACGHNLIATAAAGAAIGASRAFESLPGEVLCIGTPAEEGGAGKVLLAKAGIFDGLDATMLAHPSNTNIIFKKALGVVVVTLRFLGKTAHASAWPEKGINALDAMILFFNGVNALRQQFPRYVRVHGVITKGGEAANVIPDLTEAKVLVRALRENVLDRMLERVENIAKGAALATGCKMEWEALSELAYAPFHPNHALGDEFNKHLKNLGVDASLGPEDAGMGSSDIGNVGRLAPTIHPEFAISTREVANHTPEFAQAAGSDKAIDATIIMAKAMALTAISIFERSELRASIRAEFESTGGGA